MPADPFDSLRRAVDRDSAAAGPPAAAATNTAVSHRRASTSPPAVQRQAAFDRIQRLARKYGLTSTELHAIYALARIEELMELHGISVDELRRELAAPAPSQAAQQDAVSITNDSSKGHDTRFTVVPAEAGEGPFMADWHQRRGGEE